jgi:hypothetical protein
MFPQRSTYRPVDGLGHGGGHSGGHGGGHASRGGRGARGGFRSGGDYVVADAPLCFCDGVPCPCPYATFEGVGAYYANKFEQPISGLGSCPCSKQGTGALIGDDSSYPSPAKFALACGAAAIVVMLAMRIKV